VIGGMLGATVIAVFFIPMFFYVLETMSEKSGGGKKTPGAGPSGTPPDKKPAGPADPAGPVGTGSGGPKVTPSARREDD
jgi:multidrug efflux pump